ncbi:MAG: hypothetical protein ACREJQ_03690 [bacterium]
MRIKIALIGIVCACLIATPVFAGWRIKMSLPGMTQALQGGGVSNPNTPQLADISGFNTLTVWIEGNRMKLAFKDNWAWGYFDYDKESFALGLNAEVAKQIFATYMSPTDTEKAKAANQMPLPDPPKQAVVGTVDDTLSALQVALAPAVSMAQTELAKLPPEQREQMKPKMHSAYTAGGPEITVRTEPGTIPIAGFNTTGYQVLMDGKHILTLWSCPKVDMESLKRKSKKTSERMQSFFTDLFAQMGVPDMQIPGGAFALSRNRRIYEQVPGFPFQVNLINPETGKSMPAIIVTEAKQMKIPSTEFAVPVGYKITPVSDAITNLSALIASQMMKAQGAGQPSGQKKKSKGHTIIMENNERK